MSTCRLVVAAFALLTGVSVNAQSDNNGRLSWWPAYYLRYSINKRWVLNGDVQARNFAKQPALGLFAMRTGAHYRINDHLSIGAGGAWFHQQQLNEEKRKIGSDELRLWEDIRHEKKLNKWLLVNQFRTEQRYWTNIDEAAFRFRYRLATDYSLSGKWKMIFGNEIMWQGSKRRNNWDQYRLWVGAEYAFTELKQVQLVLMNWWQFNTSIYQPAIRVNFVQSINKIL